MRDQVPSKDMMQQLRVDAAMGLDMSPGDPAAAWAVAEIERLQRELASFQKANAELALSHTHEPPAEPIGFVARAKSDGTIFRDFARTGEQWPISEGCEWMPVYARPSQPPPVDDVEQRARARFIENHGLPARDPWDCAPSATKHEYREWARNNTPTKGDGHV